MSKQKVLDLTGVASTSAGAKRKSEQVATSVLKRLKADAEKELRAPAPEWPCSPDWPGVPEIGRSVGVQFITAVDPGEVHMGVWRFQLYPVFRPTHVKILDLHELAELRNKLQPGVQIKHSSTLRTGEKRYGTRAIYNALMWYMKREMGAGGLFDSQMLFVESQDFRRDMKGVEMVLLSIFGAARPAVRVHPEPGGERPASQCVSGASAKACYAGLFPTVKGYQCSDEYEEMERNGSMVVSSKRRGYHGFGDVKTTGAKQQYESNKRNAKVFGPMIAHVEKLRDKMGSDLSRVDYETIVKHINKNKTDDVYDAMFIGLYAINTHLQQMWRYKKKFILKPLSAVSAPPMRAKRQFEELYELMQWVGAGPKQIRNVHSGLFKK